MVAVPFKEVSNGAKIRNRYNQVPHLTQDNNTKNVPGAKNNNSSC